MEELADHFRYPLEQAVQALMWMVEGEAELEVQSQQRTAFEVSWVEVEEDQSPVVEVAEGLQFLLAEVVARDLS